MRRLGILLFVLFLWVVPTFAQQYNKYLETARKYESAHKFQKASTAYWKAVNATPKDYIVITSAATFYKNQGEYDRAIQCYEMGAKYSGATVDYALPLAELYLLKFDIGKANQILSKKAGYYNNNEASLKIYNKLNADLGFMQSYKERSQNCIVHNLGKEINSKYDEYFPSIHGNDEEIVFTRKTNGVDEDFYISQRDSLCNWLPVKDMGAPFNSTKNDGAHYLTMNRKYMFMMRCGNERINEVTMGGCDLYLAFRKNDTLWAESAPFGATINTPYYEGMPTLSSDNRTMYFVSDRPGGFGGKDIWVTKFEDGLWQIPENLGGSINTAFDELSPFLAIDDKTLYFSSNGHPGFGGFDIFVSRKLPNGNWSKPENIGRCINSSSNDWSFVVHTSGTKAYFASDRKGGYGGFDIYECAVPSSHQPECLSIVNGFVKDSLLHYHIPNAMIEIFELNNMQQLYKGFSNRGDGSYVVALPIGKTLLRKVYAFGYNERTDTFTLNRQSVANFEQLDVLLLPDYYEEPLYELDLTKVHYERNQLEINVDVLNAIVEQVLAFADTNFIIHINGYTDNTGTPYINEDFSYRRANYIAQALIKAGISPSRLEVRGWGDAHPIVENDTEEHRYLNRRVELKIIGTESLFNQLEMWQH